MSERSRRQGRVAFRCMNNSSSHNFCKLGREFLDAAKFTHAGFHSNPTWPTYFLVFQSLENFLKAYLLTHGETIEDVKRVGHGICKALERTKAKGLSVQAPPDLEAAMMKMSQAYTKRDFQYCSVGEWSIVPAHLAIEYVEAVSNALRQREIV